MENRLKPSKHRNELVLDEYDFHDKHKLRALLLKCPNLTCIRVKRPNKGKKYKSILYTLNGHPSLRHVHGLFTANSLLRRLEDRLWANHRLDNHRMLALAHGIKQEKIPLPMDILRRIRAIIRNDLEACVGNCPEVSWSPNGFQI